MDIGPGRDDGQRLFSQAFNTAAPSARQRPGGRVAALFSRDATCSTQPDTLRMQSSERIQGSRVMDWWVLVLAMVLGSTTYVLYRVVDHLRNRP